MFTGIVTDVGEVLRIERKAQQLSRLTIGCAYGVTSLVRGASIACSGVCLTLVGAAELNGRNTFDVEAAAETLQVTTVGNWRAGQRVNLERALRMGDELGGHLVSGHVDGVAEVLEREDMADSARLTFRAPKSLLSFIAPKGSVALDGVSLTVNQVDGDTFSVQIIPHTLAVTTFGALQASDKVNLEVDLMARYAARLLQTR